MRFEEKAAARMAPLKISQRVQGQNRQPFIAAGTASTGKLRMAEQA
jgi:hypothetical protein